MKIPVSIKCKDQKSHEVSWHIGVTKNISVEGITIEAGSLPCLEIFSGVEVLCFPEEGTLASYIPEPEPMKMTGRVIWQDMAKKTIGVEISSAL